MEGINMSGLNRQYGYLFMFNDNVQDSLDIMSIINEKTYKVSRKVQDLDSFRDANGVLHRNVVSNVPLTIEFQTRGGLTDTQIEATWGAIIRNSYIINKERKIHATFFVPEINDYVTQDLYVPDPEFPIRRIRKDKTLGYEVVYEPITFKFIGY